MAKRLLNCNASDFLSMNREELLNAIYASEGRTVLSENIASGRSVDPSLTNSEVARAFGADLILLNVIDVFNVNITGLPKSNDPIRDLKKLVGRPVGVNLEPVDLEAKMLEDVEKISIGRTSNVESLKKADELGFDFICLTGNPATGVTNKEIEKAIKIAKDNFYGIIIAGKMHGAGVDEEIVDMEAINRFIDAGADIILLPAIATVPGITLELIAPIVKQIHKRGKLAMSAIGTSQESSRPEVVRQIAMYNKMAGFDIQHTGDGTHLGVSPYMNIFEISMVIRGERHTINMIARSNLR